MPRAQTEDELRGGNRIYLPDVVGAGYKEFWNCKKRYRVVKGGKASKKSSTTALWYIWNMMKYPDANLLVVRQVFNTHADSTFAQLRWAIHRLRVDELWEAVRSPLEIRYKPTGQKILFRGFDDPLKLASTTVDVGYLCWVWIEEAFELPSEDGFDKFDLTAPRGWVPPPLFKQTTLTFNPWSDKHWLKKRFFDTPSDNVLTMTTNYLCNEFLDATDLSQYEEMKQTHPSRYAVAGLGEWGISEGLIYENWRVENFSVQEILRSDDGWKYRCVFGLDYGYTNDPTAFIAAAVNKQDKLLYIFDEFYERGLVNSEIAQRIKAHGFAKERIRADSAEPKSNEELRRNGIQRVFAAEKGRDSILNGISRLQEYRMVVHPNCQNAIAELSSYRWETDKTSGDGKNKPVDSDNHLMDALRYAMTDIKNFKAKERTGRERRPRGFGSGLSAVDFKGGWS
jgi:phage terminase large subunit